MHREHKIVRLSFGQRRKTQLLPNGFTEPFRSFSFCPGFGFGLYFDFLVFTQGVRFFRRPFESIMHYFLQVLLFLNHIH